MNSSLDLCLRLFPYVICMDADSRITYVSEKLSQRLPNDTLGSTLAECFTILNPAPNALDCNQITDQHIGKLFLMHTPDKSMALRGQVVDGTLQEKPVYFLSARRGVRGCMRMAKGFLSAPTNSPFRTVS